MTDLLKAALQAIDNLADEARGNGNAEEWIALQLAAFHAVPQFDLSKAPNDPMRPLNEREKNVLAPPHPGDFGIPKEFWTVTQNYADYWHSVKIEATKCHRTDD